MENEKQHLIYKTPLESSKADYLLEDWYDKSCLKP